MISLCEKIEISAVLMLIIIEILCENIANSCNSYNFSYDVSEKKLYSILIVKVISIRYDSEVYIITILENFTIFYNISQYFTRAY